MSDYMRVLLLTKAESNEVTDQYITLNDMKYYDIKQSATIDSGTYDIWLFYP